MDSVIGEVKSGTEKNIFPAEKKPARRTFMNALKHKPRQLHVTTFQVAQIRIYIKTKQNPLRVHRLVAKLHLIL